MTLKVDLHINPWKHALFNCKKVRLYKKTGTSNWELYTIFSDFGLEVILFSSFTYSVTLILEDKQNISILIRYFRLDQTFWRYIIMMLIIYVLLLRIFFTIFIIMYFFQTTTSSPLTMKRLYLLSVLLIMKPENWLSPRHAITLKRNTA